MTDAVAISRTTTGSSAQAGGFLSFIAVIFLISLAIPVVVHVGPLALLPHRALILFLFVPLLFALLAGRAGRLSAIDGLLAFSVIWAAIALAVNPGTGKVEAIGIYGLEFFGAYLVGRLGVRSAADFQRFVKVYFLILLLLFPFIVAESLLGRPILLDLIPNSVNPTFSDPRWGLRRAQGPFAHSIIFGVFAASAFGVFWYVLRPGFSRLAGLGIVVASTFFSLSTGPLISLVMQAVFIGWETITKTLKWRWRLFGILTVLAYVTIDILSNRTPFHVLVSYASFNTGSAYGRIIIWEYGIQNVYANPIFGLGLENVNWERPAWLLTSVDNYWLLTTMTYGVPSFLALAAAYILVFRNVGRAKLLNPQSIKMRAGYLTALGGIVIAGATVHYWHAMQAFVMFFLGAGLWFFSSPEQSDQTDENVDHTTVDPDRVRYTRFGNGAQPSGHRTRS
jgi:hypothetical protein